MALSATLKTNNFGTKLCPVSLSQNFGILNMERLPKDLFTYLSGINMSTISLNNNNFIHFIGTSFKSFSNIQTIYMRSNELVFVQADGYSVQ
jgi:hypothetical protein